MRHIVFSLFVLGFAATVAAQVQSRPTEPPLVTAAGEAWFALREPISIAGDVYYPAGPQVFFNGFTMVRSGHFNGVPIYSDTTLEPYSVLFVPVTRGIMQPYERLRAGALAGTTGSRMPSFPVQLVPDARVDSMGLVAAAAPTAPPQPLGAIGVFTPDGGAGASATRGTAGLAALPSATEPLVSVRRPENNDGLWIWFNGTRWLSGGPAVPFDDDRFAQIGEYAGVPVYSDRTQRPRVIYVPTRKGLVAPWFIATPAPRRPTEPGGPSGRPDSTRAPGTGPTRER